VARHPSIRWVVYRPVPGGFSVRCEACGEELAVCCPTKLDAFARAHARHVRVGDAIARATKAVGIAPCGGCEKRRKRLNRLFG